MPRSVSDERILDAAVDVVAERGFAGATTREIAAAAGINEVTLFRRFGTKANLLREAMLRELSAFTGPEGVRHTGDLHADLVHIVELYRALVHKRGRLIPVLLAEVSRSPDLRTVVEIPQRAISAIAEVLARYQAEGALVREPPLQAAAALLAPILVAAVVAGLPSGPTLGPPAIEEHVARFLGGRKARRPRARA